MTMRQTVRLLLYRWKLFALVFLLVFSGSLSAIIYLEGSKAEPIPEPIPESISELIFYTAQIIIVNMDIPAGTIEYYRFMVNTLLSGQSGLLPDDVGVLAKLEANTIKIDMTGSDRQQLTALGNELLLVVMPSLNNDFPGWKYLQSEPEAKPVPTPAPTPVPTPNRYEVALGIIANLLISFTLGVLCGLVVVFARENFDNSIRSVYHLKKASNVPVLPVIPPGNEESALLALSSSFPADKPVVLCGVSHIGVSSGLAVKLAETVARENFNVAVVDFCGSAVSSHPNVSIVSEQNKKAANCLSDAFIKELGMLRANHAMVLIAAPDVKSSGISAALAEIASIVLLVQWGKDNDKQLQFAVGCFVGRRDNMLGAAITEYRPVVEYIWE